MLTLPRFMFAAVLALSVSGCGVGRHSALAQPSAAAPPAATNAAATPPTPAAVYQLPPDLCAIVDWIQFADLYPGEARYSFGEKRFASNLSSQAECSASYGRAADLTGLRIAVEVELFREQAKAQGREVKDRPGLSRESGLGGC